MIKVGGRFSVWSAVGVLALSLQYGFGVVNQFLQGGNAMDEHFQKAPAKENLPLILGLLDVWNGSLLGYEGVAILPYCQALLRFVPHIQQLDMESNGKGVQMDGTPVAVPTGAINFGEPGTNGQHSFYQLMHQGRVVPSHFIGFAKSQNPVAWSADQGLVFSGWRGDKGTISSRVLARRVCGIKRVILQRCDEDSLRTPNIYQAATLRTTAFADGPSTGAERLMPVPQLGPRCTPERTSAVTTGSQLQAFADSWT
eukprot:Skav233964  [mRNA]  locus=scaffold1008:390893:403166:+ [translate_table: standard]